MIDIIGKCSSIIELKGTIEQVAKTDSTVLIRGESGTGKGVASKLIHYLSARKAQNFVAVNCSAIPETLLESELFGCAKGAFTGAYRDRAGKFEQANNGTIFLDEIGDMPLLMQAKLLKVLEEGIVEPLGSEKTKKVNVRLISATNKNLKDMVQKGLFREDLYYRLKVISIYMPALREREDDVVLLANYFVQKHNSLLGKTINSISPKALNLIKRYEWPGNIRELENNIQTAMILCNADTIEVENLPLFNEKITNINPDEFHENYTEMFTNIMESVFPKISVNNGRIYDLMQTSMEKALITTCLKHYDFNQVKASSALGISRNTLRKRLDVYNINSIGQE